MCLSHNRESLDCSDSAINCSWIIDEVLKLKFCTFYRCLIFFFIANTFFSAGGCVQLPARYQSYKVRSNEKHESHFCSIPSDQRSDNHSSFLMLELVARVTSHAARIVATQKMPSPSLVKTHKRSYSHQHYDCRRKLECVPCSTHTDLAHASRISRLKVRCGLDKGIILYRRWYHSVVWNKNATSANISLSLFISAYLRGF